jgi:SAM-dependent methyltransferase
MSHIDIPEKFNRNAPGVRKVGVEKTGSILIKLACEKVGFSDLSDKDVLDIGCGSRFTQTIINLDLSIGSYSGIDVNMPLISYLQENIQDSRFSFYYWDVYNELYNKGGKKLTKKSRLPLSQNMEFDLIWLFSVFTHLNPVDAENLLHILRKYYVKKGGFLFFSAFIDNNIDTFEDRVKEKPLHQAYYSEKFMRRILSKTGWQVHSSNDKDPELYIQHHFVCSPKYGFWNNLIT